ncbi:MAG: MBL fold metallo-hydrolase [Candidatus Burarchaeum sp.]|nr:MBL fold metallo-hydrolase [Candidatus Burarchaeum sp.]MDO8340290.1 MBL fold metallo-hydrolase [Candidatus Burarchaeum sp.]
MEVKFLGTRGWYPKYGQTACVLVRTGKADIIFDVGTGAAMLKDELRLDRETHIFISHFHLDHTVGLCFLLGVFKGKKLKIWGQRGVERVVRGLLRPPYFPVPVEKWPFEVEFGEIGEAGELISDARVSARPLEHSNHSIGFRLEYEGKVLAYVTDTDKCANAVRLGHGADLLIHEATYTEKGKGRGGHSTGKIAAEVARAAGAKKLALFHLDAEADAKYIARILAEAKKEFPNSVLAKDGMRLIV